MKHISQFIFILFSISTIYSCSSSNTSPTITTKQVSAINFTEAITGGSVTSNGGDPVTARGICMSSVPGPTISDRVIQATTDDFTSNLTGLTEGMTVYIRAFATNSVGTAYGSEVVVNTWKLSDTKWAFLLNYISSNYPGDVDFFADGTSRWDEPTYPGLYTTYGTWSVSGDKVNYVFGGDPLALSYIFTGTVINNNTMSGVYTWENSPDRTFSAIKY